MKTFLLILLVTMIPLHVHAYDPTNPNGLYKDLTRENLSKLYWKMDKMDINNDLHIDNFVMINKCDLYKKYYSNDFRWHNIRKNARISIAKNKDSFGQHFRIVRQIYLGRYNPEKESFALSTPIKTSKFEVRSKDNDDWDCASFNRGSQVAGYPDQAILDLSTPIEMTEVQVPSIVAFQYNMIFAENERDQRTDLRPAYLVQDIKVFNVDPGRNLNNRRGTAGISAVLEKLHIYGDYDLTMLLYSHQVR